MRKKGFILPFSIILALVVLSSLGLWYRQVILQSFLADRLLLQRGLYIECRSLIPSLTEKLNGLSLLALKSDEKGFVTIEVGQRSRWRVDRSAWTNDRIRFVFHRIGQTSEPMVLIVPYHRELVSGLPPDLTAEGRGVLEVGASRQ